MADCLLRHIYIKSTDHDCEPKGHDFGCTLFEDLLSIENVDTVLQTYYTDIMSIHILEDDQMTELQDISS